LIALTECRGYRRNDARRTAAATRVPNAGALAREIDEGCSIPHCTTMV